MSEVYEEREVVKKERTLIKMVCNRCGKEIKGDYWSVFKGHHDWGNDSCESHMNLDLCSEECVQKEWSEYLDECKYSNTCFFEVERDNFEPPKKEITVDPNPKEVIEY